MTTFEILTHLIACWIGAFLGAGAMLVLIMWHWPGEGA